MLWCDDVIWVGLSSTMVRLYQFDVHVGMAFWQAGWDLLPPPLGRLSGVDSSVDRLLVSSQWSESSVSLVLRAQCCFPLFISGVVPHYHPPTARCWASIIELDSGPELEGM